MLRKNTKIELLTQVPLFAGCSKRELADLALLGEELDFPAGTTLIREGDLGRNFFVLVEGTVEIRRKGRKIATQDHGFFGEIALLLDSPTTATVTTTSDVLTLIISPQSFRRLLKSSPGIQQKVMTALAERLAPATI